jgi:hypothetical protein
MRLQYHNLPSHCSSIVLFHTRYVLRNIHAHAHDVNRNHVKFPLVLDTKSRLRRELYKASMRLTPAVLKALFLLSNADVVPQP